MKVILLFLSAVSLFFNVAVFANYTCSRGCDSQCDIGPLKVDVTGYCFAGCKAWQLAKCYNVSDPYVSTMGELGQSIYVGAASTMKVRNPISSDLDANEKKILRPFYGDLVDRIHLHLKANLMDRWGDEPYQIQLGSSTGQTYGHDVYIRYFRTELDRVALIGLIGHEICHARQYEQRGSSLQKFGRDYFEGFASVGGYYNNPMEKECRDLEPKFEDAAATYWQWFDEHKRAWNFEVCNHTDFDSIFIALGWPHLANGGFSLVPMRTSKGWFPVPKGQCKVILSNIASEEEVDAYATTGAQGDWTSWSNGSGPAYCIHPTNSFLIGDHYVCKGAGQEKISFTPLQNPWRTQGNGTYQWNFTGTATRLHVCNQSGKPVDGAFLKADRGSWRTEGWYGFAVGQCREWNFGFYKGSVYLFGENLSTGTTWGDATKPKFCVYDGTAFDNDQSTKCFVNQGGKLVSGYQIMLNPGTTPWNFRP